MAKSKKIVIVFTGTASLVILLILAMTPAAVNMWLLATERVYVVPKESSIFSFRPTVMNPGSGDWWIYGEDNINFYYFTGEGPSRYALYPKELAPQCAGFRPTDYDTWCLAKRNR